MRLDILFCFEKTYFKICIKQQSRGGVVVYILRQIFCSFEKFFITFNS